MFFLQILRKSINLISATMENPWPVIKPVAGHVGCDYGAQSLKMATNKNGCILWRLAHIAIIAFGHAAVAVTSEVGWRNRLEYIAFNTATHYAADCVKLPKCIDQAIHIGCAAYSGLRWLR